MKVFAVYGVSSRGCTKIRGKGYVEADSYEEVVKSCLVKMDYEDVSDEDLEEWFGEKDRGVYIYDNDPGDFVFVGENEEKVMEVCEDYL